MGASPMNAAGVYICGRICSKSSVYHPCTTRACEFAKKVIV